MTFLDVYKIFILLVHFGNFIRFTSPVPSDSCNTGSPRRVLEAFDIEINRSVWE